MENTKKFFEELAKTEEAKALFKSVEIPETEEARIAAYIDIAGKLGIELTADEINAYFAADKADVAEISDKELEQLSSGADTEACGLGYRKLFEDVSFMYMSKCSIAVVELSYRNKLKSLGLK